MVINPTRNECEYYVKELERLQAQKKSMMVKKDVKKGRFEAADTWKDQDRLARQLGNECYEKAQTLIQQGDFKNGQNFLRMAAQFLRLAHLSKKECDLDELNRRLRELEKKQVNGFD